MSAAQTAEIVAPSALIVKALAKRPKRVPEYAAPPNRSDEAIAARHKSILLVKQRPDLWPVLNVLSLSESVDWPYVFEQLQALATLANVA